MRPKIFLSPALMTGLAACGDGGTATSASTSTDTSTSTITTGADTTLGTPTNGTGSISTTQDVTGDAPTSAPVTTTSETIAPDSSDTTAAGTCTPLSTQPCYTGPAETEDIGLCKAGTQTCDENGSAFGACEGEVLPAPEDCATPDDEDCDGSTPACAGVPQWAHLFGDALEGQESYGLVALADGSSYLGAHIVGVVDFGTGPLVAAGQDIVLARYDADGAAVWAKKFPGSGGTLLFDVAADAAENIAITGWFNGDVDLGGGKLVNTGKVDIYLAKFDATGKHLWSKRFGGPELDFATATGIGPGGEVFVSGDSHGALDLGGGVLANAGANDIFVAKYSAAGVHQWSKRFGDAAAQVNASLDVGSDGHALLAGWFLGSVDFGGDSLVSAGEGDVYLAKLAPDGAHLWSARYGDAAQQEGQNAVVHPTTGAIALTGNFRGTLDLGGDPLVSAGDKDVFVAVFEADGTHVWSRGFGDLASQLGEDIDFTPDGGVVVVGDYAGTIDLGGGPLVAGDISDTFVAKFTATGEHVYSMRVGEAGVQQTFTISADPTGAALISGAAHETFEIGPFKLVAAGGNDILFAKIGP